MKMLHINLWNLILRDRLLSIQKSSTPRVVLFPKGFGKSKQTQTVNKPRAETRHPFFSCVILSVTQCYSKSDVLILGVGVLSCFRPSHPQMLFTSSTVRDKHYLSLWSRNPSELTHRLPWFSQDRLPNYVVESVPYGWGGWSRSQNCQERRWGDAREAVMAWTWRWAGREGFGGDPHPGPGRVLQPPGASGKQEVLGVRCSFSLGPGINH